MVGNVTCHIADVSGKVNAQEWCNLRSPPQTSADKPKKRKRPDGGTRLEAYKLPIQSDAMIPGSARIKPKSEVRPDVSCRESATHPPCVVSRYSAQVKNSLPANTRSALSTARSILS